MTNREFLETVRNILTERFTSEEVRANLLRAVDERLAMLSKPTAEDIMNDIFREVCSGYQLSTDDVFKLNQSRTRPYTEIRQICFALFTVRIGYFPTLFGRFFEKNHCTVNYSVKNVINLLETNRNFTLMLQNKLRNIITDDDILKIKSLTI